jgi:osmotically-inducible protein OsmY
MLGRKQVPDNALLRTINQKIARTGTSSQSKVAASVRNGAVTLTGNLQFDRQRTPIVKAVSHIAGVRSVVDQMKVVAKRV